MNPVYIVTGEANILDKATVELTNSIKNAAFLRPLVKSVSWGAIYGVSRSPDGAGMPDALTYATYDFPKLRKLLKSLTPKSRRRVAKRMLYEVSGGQDMTRTKVLELMKDPEGMQTTLMMSTVIFRDLSHYAAIKCWLVRNVRTLRKEVKYIKINKDV